jgi:diacylglycerol kinase
MSITNFKKQIILRKQSFGYALAGCKGLWLEEMNFRIHVIISVLTLSFGFLLKINLTEWVGILICIGLVLSAEAFNTAIEHICNLNTKEIKPEIKTIKDISAFAVLVLAIISMIVGIIIFLPKIYNTFTSI